MKSDSPPSRCRDSPNHQLEKLIGTMCWKKCRGSLKTLNARENGGTLNTLLKRFPLSSFYDRYNAGRRYSTAAARRAICSAQERSEKSERSQQLSRKLAARVAREVVTFWNKINKVRLLILSSLYLRLFYRLYNLKISHLLSSNSKSNWNDS